MSKTEEKRYFWEFDRNAYRWENEEESSIEDCIKSAKREDPEVEYIYIGELEEHVPVVCVDRIIDDLREEAMDECCESSDGWLDQTPGLEQLEEELNQALNNWLYNNNLNPDFGTITNITKHSCKGAEDGK